jgi:hypothetical protein
LLSRGNRSLAKLDLSENKVAEELKQELAILLAGSSLVYFSLHPSDNGFGK